MEVSEVRPGTHPESDSDPRSDHAGTFLGLSLSDLPSLLSQRYYFMSDSPVISLVVRASVSFQTLKAIDLPNHVPQYRLTHASYVCGAHIVLLRPIHDS